VDVAEWLRGIGLGRYASAFAENDIDRDVLSRLTADDLRDLGSSQLVIGAACLTRIAALSEHVTNQATSVPLTSTLSAGAERPVDSDVLRPRGLDRARWPARPGRPAGGDRRLSPRRCRRSRTLRRLCREIHGDGVLVYFGYPHAQEDDAERAVRAGLSLIEHVPALDTGARLRTRIGIATGLVVVGDLIGADAAQERGVVGETPNLAARLQTMAEPNTLPIDETTRRILFAYRVARQHRQGA
jgi:SAM (Sterile alpha motif) domain-containing protein/adenylate/guanylate cyclase family protein